MSALKVCLMPLFAPKLCVRTSSYPDECDRVVKAVCGRLGPQLDNENKRTNLKKMQERFRRDEDA